MIRIKSAVLEREAVAEFITSTGKVTRVKIPRHSELIGWLGQNWAARLGYRCEVICDGHIIFHDYRQSFFIFMRLVACQR